MLVGARGGILDELRKSRLKGYAFREMAMTRLSHIEGYDWCGVYRLDGDVLVLDAYVGAESEHQRIPVGEGICGAAVATNSNQIVPDVSARQDYLACSKETRSEIVVLIRQGKNILGQIDIDSHSLDRFSSDAEAMLESLAGLIAERWKP